MPKRKSDPRWHETPAVVATLSTVEEALNLVDSSALNLAPTATAVELPAEWASPQPASRKTARVHEVMDMDPTDSNYVFCQCLKSAGGGVCGARLKNRGSCSALWTHVKTKHPSTHASLVLGDNKADIQTAEDTLASTAQLKLNVPYQQLVYTLSCAPAHILSAAIESLQRASEQRSRAA